MRRFALGTVVAGLTATSGVVMAQTTSGLTANPATVTFSYQVNATTLPGSQNVTINAAGAAAASTLSVAVVSVPPGWLTVTPDSGRAPLALVVSANPTGLAPGSYSGTITVNTVPAGSNPATVTVTLSV